MSTPKTCHVWLSDEYLDGYMDIMVDVPSEYHPEVMVVRTELIDAHERAWRELVKAAEALRRAMRTAPRRKNPKYDGGVS